MLLRRLDQNSVKQLLSMLMRLSVRLELMPPLAEQLKDGWCQPGRESIEVEARASALGGVYSSGEGEGREGGGEASDALLGRSSAARMTTTSLLDRALVPLASGGAAASSPVAGVVLPLPAAKQPQNSERFMIMTWVCWRESASSAEPG